MQEKTTWNVCSSAEIVYLYLNADEIHAAKIFLVVGAFSAAGAVVVF